MKNVFCPEISGVKGKNGDYFRHADLSYACHILPLERTSWKSDSGNLDIVFLDFCTVFLRVTQFDTFA